MNEINLARGVMMGIIGTLTTHPELDGMMVFLAVRNMVDEQLDLMLSQMTEETNGLHDNEESNE